MHLLSKQNIIKIYEQVVQKKQIAQLLSKEKSQFQITNLVGSSLSFLISESFKKVEKPFLVILNDKEEAAYYLNDLEQLLNDKDVLFYPGSYRRPYQIEETDNANVLLRSEVLNRINSRKKPALIVTYPDALFEQVVTKAELNRNTLKLNLKDNLSLDFVNEVLFENPHLIAWEDLSLRNGRLGDEDYNDLIYLVDAAPVPEPSTIMLVSLGIMGLVGMRKRNGKHD